MYRRVYLTVENVYDIQFLTKTHHCDCSVLQIYDFISIFHDRTCIGTKKKFIFSNSYNQWTLLSSSDNLIRIIFIQYCYSISSDNFMKRKLNGCQQIQILLYFDIFYKLNKYLSICI